jgi:uncharacterized membrane protein
MYMFVFLLFFFVLQLLLKYFLICICKFISKYTSLPMQSVTITTDAVSSNLDQGEVYNIMYYYMLIYMIDFDWIKLVMW